MCRASCLSSSSTRIRIRTPHSQERGRSASASGAARVMFRCQRPGCRQNRARMKVLFIGGTGYISEACTKLAVARGIDITVLNRLNRGTIEGSRSIVADIADTSAAEKALRGTSWDAVVDFIAF